LPQAGRQAGGRSCKPPAQRPALTWAGPPPQVERLQKRVRDPRAGYLQTLSVLKAAKE
jgi:hypothetical protein